MTFDGILVGSGVLWTLTYLLIIRQGFLDRTYGMPLAARVFDGIYLAATVVYARRATSRDLTAGAERVQAAPARRYRRGVHAARRRGGRENRGGGGVLINNAGYSQSGA